MKRAVLMFLLVAACDGASSAAPDAGPPQRPALSFTDWTERTELFAETRAFVVNEDSPVAAHVTRLANFSALDAGTVTVVLTHAGGAIERFDARAPDPPGIFRPIARPTSAGAATLSVEIRAEGIDVVHQLGDVEIFTSDDAARAAIPEEPPPPGRITFLKEQQWPIPFGTTIVGTRTIRSSIPMFGTVETRTDSDVVVIAPSAGRVTDASLPSLGASVTAGQVLASLAPQLAAADRASLDLAVASARIDVAQAERELSRLEALRTEGAVPERRVIEAQHAVEEAQAALTAATRRLATFERTLRTGGASAGGLPVRAPLAGEITEVLVAPGQLVDEGTPLFRVVRPGSTWLTLDIPEGDLARVSVPVAASFRAPGEEHDHEVAADALVALTRVVDPTSRTAPARFALDGVAVASGTHVEGRLFVGAPLETLAIPWSAVVDDGGVQVAYVQVEGESFARRPLRLGARDGDWIAIESGLAAGEHVVSTGALAVKLAGASGTVPAHGHSH